MLELFTTSFITFLVVVDPLGNAPIFSGLVEGHSRRAKMQIALRGVLVAAAVLTGFLFVGQTLLTTLGIGLPAFRIAGGLLLFYIAFEMLFEKRRARKTETAEKLTADDSAEDDLSIAVFPLAVPLLAGPGAFAAAILLGTGVTQVSDQLMVLAGLLAVMALCALSLSAAARFTHLLGTTLTDVMTRLLGVLLAALSVQYVIDGVLAIG